MEQNAPKVLFVEEDPTLAEVTAFRLELLGYRVETVRSAEEAVESVKAEPPDLVIVDLLLPGMNGVDLIDRLLSDGQTGGMTVMALSIEADPDAVQRAFAAGAKDYLVAPYSPAILEAKVEKLLTAAGKVI